MSLIEPVDKVWYYESVKDIGVDSNLTAVSFLLLGLGNIVKIFIPKKPFVIIDMTMKMSMFFLLVMMSLSTMRYSVFHIVSIFYAMTAVISVSVIIRSP